MFNLVTFRFLSLLHLIINLFQVDAVGKTSVTLSVKQRIAEGLSRAGTSNTLKVVSYNAILGVIAVFSVGAVRQFCVFAIVVLVAHWFLAHTFFMAVLSIDVQRLEVCVIDSIIVRHYSQFTASLANYCGMTPASLQPFADPQKTAGPNNHNRSYKDWS
jgi:Sterol-sensing domain of SREBP cleavage-activation